MVGHVLNADDVEGDVLVKHRHTTPAAGTPPVFRKDETLNELAETFNVAQFVSFAPGSEGPEQQFSRIADFVPNYDFGSVDKAIQALFARSSDGTVNVRSFSAEQAQSREFIYGITTPADAVAAVQRIAREGAYTIVNETINVSDGGVSGVVMGSVVEFRPDSTPRGVEQPGFASLPTEWAQNLFKKVYNVDLELQQKIYGRLEFSLHPQPRGWKQTHVIFWEHSTDTPKVEAPQPSWPNDFSRMIGDKVYGLLVADAVGVPVPKTMVISRRIAPFTFGCDTGSSEQWIRTSPREQVPGKFTTSKGWQDPFKLVQDEDPRGTDLSSILAQQGVVADWSGAAIETERGDLIVEGVQGSGENFMLGRDEPQKLSPHVQLAVADVHHKLRSVLGPVRFEWVFDGGKAWVVQLHRGASKSEEDVIVPGEAESWVRFPVSSGLEALRTLVASLDRNIGIMLDRKIGVTSHLADVLRKHGAPARVSDMG